MLHYKSELYQITVRTIQIPAITYLAMAGTLVNGPCSCERSSAVARRFRCGCCCCCCASLGELPPLLPLWLSLVLLLLTFASSGCSWVASCPISSFRKKEKMITNPNGPIYIGENMTTQINLVFSASLPE